MHRRVFSWVAFCILGAIAGDCAPASAASVIEKQIYMRGPRYDAALPACNEPAALWKIQRTFASKEGRFWNSELTIVSFDRVHEIATRPWAEGSIPRRFCSGRALMSDGRWRRIDYAIIEDGGMIGGSWGVQWCVVGLDRNWAYAPGCKMARP